MSRYFPRRIVPRPVLTTDERVRTAIVDLDDRVERLEKIVGAIVEEALIS